MNKIVMLVIFIMLNLVAFYIDPILGGIFLLLWLYWYNQRIDEFDR